MLVVQEKSIVPEKMDTISKQGSVALGITNTQPDNIETTEDVFVSDIGSSELDATTTSGEETSSAVQKGDGI